MGSELAKSKAWPWRVAVQTLAVAACCWLTLNAAYLTGLTDQMRNPPAWLGWIADRGWFPFGAEAGTLSIEDYCPLGPLEGSIRFVQSLFSGQGLSFVGPVTLRNLGVLLAIVLLVLVTKKTFCSWLCPFGTVFEAVERAGRLLRLPVWRPPGIWDRRLRRNRYGVLLLLVAATAASGTLIFKRIDPFFALYSLGSGAAEAPAIIILAALLGTAPFCPGIWCHYLCPLGAALDPVSRLGRIRVTRRDTNCTHCGRCSHSCPQNIPVTRRERIDDAQCTNCLRCLDACPEADVLELRLELRR